jgi:N-methylhydantoinase A
LSVTEGQRDSLEMAYENRFAQYDINADRPAPLVPRHLRWPVAERLDWQGQVLRPLDEASVTALLSRIEAEGIQSVAVGLIHAYANPAHEVRIAEIFRKAYPELAISLSSEVCPEIREYERQSTTVANAYVQPLMARYLTALEEALVARGFACPFFLMTSGGGLTTVETAVRLPIRLVESGPAGGAILASRVAAECGLDQVVSFDMGGTTAKLCLIDDGQPLLSRSFEIGRAYRFMKGSGLPLKIPVIEMVEIGAGGGSIASVDHVGRLTVGPESAGSDPGPACYQRGGSAATVTDADLMLGRIDPSEFAAGAVPLAPERAKASIAEQVGAPLALEPTEAAFGIAEMVDEAMANAARVHAIEWGKEISHRSVIAFGGAAPLHAARLAQKLEINRVIIPPSAGVGSAVGFLYAPISFEVVRSRYLRLADFDPEAVNALIEEMLAEATAVVRQGAPEGPLEEQLMAAMRYLGQGHEVTVELPSERFAAADREALRAAFEARYESLYGRTIPDLEVEILSWAATVRTVVAAAPRLPDVLRRPTKAEARRRQVYDPTTGFLDTAVYQRRDLKAGDCLAGPALVVEAQTTTVVPLGFELAVMALGSLELTRK